MPGRMQTAAAVTGIMPFRRNNQSSSALTPIQQTAHNCCVWDCVRGRFATSTSTVQPVDATANHRILPGSTVLLQRNTSVSCPTYPLNRNVWLPMCMANRHLPMTISSTMTGMGNTKMLRRKQKAQQNQIAPRPTASQTLHFSHEKITAGQHININTADTTQLKRIPGIGSYYAKRIVQHRERLGGLYSPTQLREIENFPESSLQYMTVGERQQSTALPAGVRRIRINNLNARDLSRHPYIRYAQAKQIEERRRMKGNFTSAGELGALPSFSQQEITRLAPYLDFE